MLEFINSLKNTTYYEKLILNSKVIMLYVGGSQSVNLIDSKNDYDLIAIVDDSKTIDMSNSLFLTYKGKKVHWYYWPLSDFLSCSLGNLWLIGSIYFRNIDENLIIYKNKNYTELINEILLKKFEISKLAIYKLLNVKHSVILRTIEQSKRGKLDCYTKLIYHLCIAIYYLTGETLNIELLNNLKKLNPILNADDLIIINNYLSNGLAFIKKVPIDYEKELSDLYDELSK